MAWRGALASAVALVVAAGAAGCSPAPEPVELVLATGPSGAVYREIGQAYADVVAARSDAVRLRVLHTDAAVENAQLLRSGGADVAFVNVDVTDRTLGDDVVALARVFDSVLHVVVPAGSPVHTLEDLRGARVAGGLERSGTRFLTEEVLSLLGVEVELVTLSQTDGAAALREGRVDALVSLAALPTPAVSDLAAATPVRLLDLADVAEQVVARHPRTYSAVAVPATTYDGVGSVTALAVPTLLAVRADLDDALAHALVDALFDGADALADERPEAAQVNPRTGSATTPTALHPGAAAWFREHKP